MPDHRSDSEFVAQPKVKKKEMESEDSPTAEEPKTLPVGLTSLQLTKFSFYITVVTKSL